MPVLSMVSIATIIAVITAAGRESLLVVGPFADGWLASSTMLPVRPGICDVPKLFKMDEKTCRTIALEVGLQNTGLGFRLALKMGKVATVGVRPPFSQPIMI